MEYIAHIRESDGQIQSVREHLLDVKTIAESIGDKMNVKHIAGLAGMLHDLGKFTNEFRAYILEAVKNPTSPPKRGSVDHSTAGGKLLYSLYHEKNGNVYTMKLSEIVGNAIISHHSYLKDFFNADLESDYLKRVRDKELLEFETAKENLFKHVISEGEFFAYVEEAAKELKEFLLKIQSQSNEFKYMFLTKIIFSVLIDADRTNTRLFEENKQYESYENNKALVQTYYDRVMEKINAFQQNDHADTSINLLRNEMSEQCDVFAEKPSGIYTLSIPTGGGKTLASLRYALKHSKCYGKKRIIYVVPFTTIIEQNANEVRKILRDTEHILEHHSNIIDDDDDNEEYVHGIMSNKQKLKLAKDNWDSPIIFTTMVQFLDVIYAKGSRNIRRFHNLTESVIIFDEVQKVPIPCVSLFNNALNFLKEYGKSSIVLCTATQPALDFVEHKLAINTDGEMIALLNDVIKAFKRVDVVDVGTKQSFTNQELLDFVIEKSSESKSILVILNTKKVVKDLYEGLKECDMGIPLYHLSTSMCAGHRNSILDEVRDQLKIGNKIVCVSTQLIEAGVDISFECVIRSMAGLDSIAQAAGRCNRHGEMGNRSVYVIDHEEENLDKLKEIKVGKQITKRIFIDLKRNKNNYGGHILSKEAMERYFQEFYNHFKTDLNYYLPYLKKDMTELLMGTRKDNSYRQAYIYKYKKQDFPLFILNSYGTAAKYFRVIDNLTTSVIVPYGEGKEIIAELNSGSSIEGLSRLLRKSQQYTINLFEHEKRLLIGNDGLIYLMDGKILALKESAYSEKYGVEVQNDSGFSSSIF